MKPIKIIVTTLILTLFICGINSCVAKINRMPRITVKSKQRKTSTKKQDNSTIPNYSLLQKNGENNNLIAPGVKINKSFMDEISPLMTVGNWGYIDHKGFMNLNSYFRSDSPFFRPEDRNFYEFTPSYFGAWWNNFINSIK